MGGWWKSPCERPVKTSVDDGHAAITPDRPADWPREPAHGSAESNHLSLIPSLLDMPKPATLVPVPFAARAVERLGHIPNRVASRNAPVDRCSLIGLASVTGRPLLSCRRLSTRSESCRRSCRGAAKGRGWES